MHLAPTEDQVALRDAVHALLLHACPPARVRAAWDRPDPDLRALLAAQGLLGIDVPSSLGGLGLGPCEWLGVLEETGWFAAPIALVESVACARWLAEAGEPELARGVCAGTAVVAVGVEGEPVVDADRADVVLLIRGREVERVVGGEVRPVSCVDGSVHTGRVTGGRRAALDGDGGALADRAAVAAAAQLLGLGERMLDLAVEHVRTRHQFGRPIGSFQAVQHALADALLELRFAAPLVAAAAFALAEDLPTRSRDASLAKAAASEAAWLAGRKALQVHGAIGYTFEYDLHLYMKRAWVLGSLWGDARFHRARLAATVLDFPGEDHV